MKPSEFLSDPMGSIVQISEAETVALNIMVILSRTGNVFRPLNWNEYQVERQKDGNFSKEEYPYFNQVIRFCQSDITARQFSPVWEKT